MTDGVEHEGLVSRLPKSVAWEFGGHPYALEPLVLPSHPEPRARLVDADRVTTLRSLLSDAARRGQDPRDLQCGATPRTLPVNGDTEVEHAFWFRWMTGHQATFAIWQLLAAVLDEVEHGSHDPVRNAREARLLVRGYALMLLYTGSATREIYDRVIRPTMSRQHRSLSGSWARDCLPVRALLRGKRDFGNGPSAAALRHECILAERVHGGVALKLVPSGVSLLQQQRGTRGTWRMPRAVLQCLYDGVFLTSRGKLGYEDVARQLVRRIHAMVLDVTAHGLDARFASSLHQEPPELRTREIAEYKESFVPTLLEVAGLAADAAPPPTNGSDEVHTDASA